MTDHNCLFARHEPNHTPNNYDITINPYEIPPNIPCDNIPNLEKRLSKLMPTSKRIHLNSSADSADLEKQNAFNLNTKLKINNKTVNFI